MNPGLCASEAHTHHNHYFARTVLHCFLGCDFEHPPMSSSATSKTRYDQSTEGSVFWLALSHLPSLLPSLEGMLEKQHPVFSPQSWGNGRGWEQR